MLRVIIFTLISTLITFTNISAQNCPNYSNMAQGLGEACGEQTYNMSVENTACNGQIFFQYSGTLDGGFWPILPAGTMRVVSVLTGNVIVSGTGNANYTNNTVGPIDPNVEGTAFRLEVESGNITISQNGNSIANVTGGHLIFHLNIDISPATITITTPSGPIVRTMKNCNDFNVQVPLGNTNFCTPINVTLPWTIVCDATGATLATGTHDVIVNPQVPTDASDLVDIAWNNTTCSWDVSPLNDCDALDIGTIFTISPDPAVTNNYSCIDGNETFTVDYVGIAGAPDCCATAGPKVGMTYEGDLASSDAVVEGSPFGGVNNSAVLRYPPNNIGGDAVSLDLCVDVSGFCFDSPGSPLIPDNSFFVFIFIDGMQVYMSPQITGTSHNICIDLTDVPSGYTQGSNVEIYVLPNTFSTDPNTPPVFYTNYAPNKTCGTLADGEWFADITATINVVFEEQIGSPVLCSSDLTPSYTGCGAVDPIDISENTPADCDASSTVIINNYNNSETYNISPAGATLGSSGIISGAPGSYTITSGAGACSSSATFTIDPQLPNVTPTFNITSNICEGTTPPTLPTTSTNGVSGTWNPAVVDAVVGTGTYTFTPTVGQCASVVTVDITVSSGLIASFTADNTSGCAPLKVDFTNTSVGNGTCSYTISNGVVLNDCNPSYTFTQSGCYDVTLTVTNETGCSGSVTENSIVCVDESPTASFIANPGKIGGLTDIVHFNNTSSNANSYEWTLGDGSTSNETHPTHKYDLEESRYVVTLVAINASGCTDTISQVIPVEEELIYFIPNTFTPDGNEINQVFKPIFSSGFDPNDYHLTIFNRWGEKVFESYDADYGWDGSYGVNVNGIVKEGVYLYKIVFKSNYNDKRMEVVGHVNLIR